MTTSSSTDVFGTFPSTSAPYRGARTARRSRRATPRASRRPHAPQGRPLAERLDLHNLKRLSEGTFLNLYVYGYDEPEAYATRREGRYYYAFFVEGEREWKGELELRGLEAGQCTVRDYANNRELGIVDAGKPLLDTTFLHALLLEATAAAPSSDPNIYERR